VIAGIPARARAGDCPDRAVRSDDAQRVALAFEHIDVVLAIHRHSARVDQRRVRRGGSVLGKAALPVAGGGAANAGPQVDGADTAVIEIGEIKVFVPRIERGAVEAAELRLPRRPAVAAEARGACSRKSADPAAFRVKLTNALVPRVGQKQVSGGKGGETV